MPLLPPERRSVRTAASFVVVLAGALFASLPAPAQTAKKPPAAKKDPAKKNDKDKGTETPAPAPEAAATTTPSPEDAQKEEEKRKEFSDKVESPRAIYFSGDLAFTRPDLGGISDNTGFDRTAANGLLYGLSAGLRLRDLRFGARWRVYDTTEFTLWTVAASVGYGLPLRPLSPILSAHVGYVFDQQIEEALFRSSLPPRTVLPPDVDVQGLLVGLDLNASYWITKFLRLGAFVGADLMFLHRAQASRPVSVANEADLASNPLYADSGSSVGINFNLGFRGAFDIGF